MSKLNAADKARQLVIDWALEQCQSSAAAGYTKVYLYQELPGFALDACLKEGFTLRTKQETKGIFKKRIVTHQWLVWE